MAPAAFTLDLLLPEIMDRPRGGYSFRGRHGHFSCVAILSTRPDGTWLLDWSRSVAGVRVGKGWAGLDTYDDLCRWIVCLGLWATTGRWRDLRED